MLVNDHVDLLHQADSLVEGDDDLLVVGDVVVGEGAALPILEPFLTDFHGPADDLGHEHAGAQAAIRLDGGPFEALVVDIYSLRETRR